MDALRRDTDYALRMMVSLARHDRLHGVSTRQLAMDEGVPYPLACKLMQSLGHAHLVESTMGPKGGFRLSRDPGQVRVMDVIEAVQGLVTLKGCLTKLSVCLRRDDCCIRAAFGDLQAMMDEFFTRISLQDLLDRSSPGCKGAMR